jgi:GGDEF domain-containing protein
VYEIDVFANEDRMTVKQETIELDEALLLGGLLTGLPNRRQFDASLKAALAAPPRSGAAHAVFLLDLNGFKQVNDVHGHGIGDELLIVAAQRLLSAVRDGDLVARFGGDEFAILARHVSGASRDERSLASHPGVGHTDRHRHTQTPDQCRDRYRPCSARRLDRGRSAPQGRRGLVSREVRAAFGFAVLRRTDGSRRPRAGADGAGATSGHRPELARIRNR